MSKFAEMNENINNVLMKLISSQDLCKLLYYKSDNPLLETDISDSSSLLYSLIFPYPITIEVYKDSNGNPIATSFINVFFDNFKLGNTNTKFKNGRLVFIILCHTSLWRLSTSTLRPFSILQAIDELFSEQRVIGIGKCEFESCNLISTDSLFSGYRLVYKNYEFL